MIMNIKTELLKIKFTFIVQKLELYKKKNKCSEIKSLSTLKNDLKLIYKFTCKKTKIN